MSLTNSSRSFVSSVGGGAGAGFFFVFRCARQTSAQRTQKAGTNKDAQNSTDDFLRQFLCFLVAHFTKVPVRLQRVFTKKSMRKLLLGRRALVVGPVNKHRATNHEVARHEAPVATVFTVVAIVAHHEVTVLRHDELVFALEHIVVLLVVFRTRFVIDVVKLTGFPRWFVDDLQRIFAVVISGGDAMLGNDLAINDNAVSLDAEFDRPGRPITRFT